jgi:holo-[acyl-carrier protein] synthase
MRIFGIGIDVVEVDRIAAAIERQGEPFLARVFTPAERAYCEAHRHPAPHFAARFAAKEAVAKALGTGIGANAGLLDLEVIHQTSGAPAIRLTGAAEDFASRHRIREIHLSLTHGRDYAAANAVVMADEPDAVEPLP